MKFPLGEMTVGDILDRGLKLLFARLPVFFLINLLVLSPVIAILLAMPFAFESAEGMDQNTALMLAGAALFAVLLALVLQPIGTAAVLHIVMEEYAGRPASMGQALSFALSRFGTLFAVSLLYGLLVGVGFLLCCVPGMIWLAMYCFVGQVVVVERLGVGGAFERSAQLTRGYRWRVFGVLFLMGLANGILQNIVQTGLNAALPAQEIVPAANGVRLQVNPVNHFIDTAVTQGVNILLTTYIAVCTTLLYLDLRIRKEGFDLELAAQLGEEPDTDRPRRRRRDEYDDEDDEDEYDDRPRSRRREADDDDDEDRPPPRRRGRADDDADDDDWDYDNDRPKRRPPGGLR